MMVDGSLPGIIDFQSVLLDLDGFSCLLPAAYFIASMWRAEDDRSINRQSTVSSIISSSMIRKTEWHSS